MPVDAPVAVVVPIVHVSALSSHAIIALSPVEPRSTIIPASAVEDPAPVANSINLSDITVLVELTVVVVPFTVRLPAVTVPVVVILLEPVSIVPNPEVIDPLFKAPTATSVEVII